MMIRPLSLAPVLLLLPAHAADVKVSAATNPLDSGFQFESVPAPAIDDAAATAEVILIDGDFDPNGGALGVLVDGKVAGNADQPKANFFFRAGTNGGRVAVDLKEAIPIREVNTYSWHAGSRGPQVYRLFAADGTDAKFQPAPKKDTDPATVGWTLVGTVDTRPAEGEGGGQHGVSLSAGPKSDIGRYRHLLFDIDRTQDRDGFGNTFFTEIDVINADSPEPKRLKAGEKIVKTYPSADKKYQYIIDSTKAPDLTEWSEKELVPVIEEWYPKIVELLPSAGFRAPDTVVLEFKDDMGGTPAYAVGHRLSLNIGWFRDQLEGEARGCVVHELVHTVQNYWQARRNNRNPSETPGWVTEGIADYVRWFLYEPESKGAEIHARNLGQARYDASYRITGNFLDWVIRTYEKPVLKELNGAAREGKYDEKLWKKWTGKTLEELGAEWKKHHETRIAG